MSLRPFLFLLILSFQSPGTTWLYGQENLPLKGHQPLPRLTDLRCEALEAEMKNEIYKNPAWKKLAMAKRMAIGIVSFEDLESIKYAGLDANQ